MNKKIFFWIIILILGVVLLVSISQSINKNTQNPETKDLIFLGDSGMGNEKQKNVAESIKKYCSNNRCFEGYILGDVIYNKGVTDINDNQFHEKFEKQYKDLNFPFYIVFGNHDYFGCTDCYIKYSSRLWKMPAYFYKRSVDNVDLFIIDTENFDINQQKWLKNELKQSKKTLKVVMGHRPLITYEEAYSGVSWPGKKELEEILCQNKVDIYISGHSHILEYIDKKDTCGFKQIISGGGGADIRKIKTNSVDKFYLEKNGFVSLEINKNNNFILRFIDDKANVKYIDVFRK